MLLSSMNFVNNHKFSDFIISKIKEEQDGKGKLYQTCSEDKENEIEATMVPEEMKKEMDVEANDTEVEEDDDTGCVSIETTDGYFITVDLTSLQICLNQSMKLTRNGVFERIEFPCPQESRVKTTVCVFRLDCNRQYYLATSPDRHLELQSYCDDTLNPDEPDERFFCVHEVRPGAYFLQPYAHKGYYLHHLDSRVSVRKLEINWRPPEEFFVHIKKSPSAKDLETEEEEKTSTLKSIKMESVEEEVPNGKTKVYRLSRPKETTLQSPITPKPGLLSCFRFSKRDKRKRKDKVKR